MSFQQECYCNCHFPHCNSYSYDSWLRDFLSYVESSRNYGDTSMEIDTETGFVSTLRDIYLSDQVELLLLNLVFRVIRSPSYVFCICMLTYYKYQKYWIRRLTNLAHDSISDQPRIWFPSVLVKIEIFRDLFFEYLTPTRNLHYSWTWRWTEMILLRPGFFSKVTRYSLLSSAPKIIL